MQFIRFLFLVLISVTLFACTKNQKSRPNIILINIDDLGWRDPAYMGSKFSNTPNIDLLAANGLVFTQAYAAASNCAPSRASMLTGKWTTRHGMYTVGTSARGRAEHRKLIPVENKLELATSFQTLAHLLKDKGYTCIHAGKWHISKDPIPFGFDINIGGGHNGHPKSYYPPYKNVSVESGTAEHLTDLIMEKVLEEISNTTDPFFLHYTPYAVHTPIMAIDSLMPKYRQINDTTDGTIANKGYLTMIENLDRNIGLLMGQLHILGILHNSLIIFTSDNGGLFGITEQRPLRAGKGSYYEGGIRVPLLFYWNGTIHQGISETPVTHLDILPTILDFIQIQKTSGEEFDGISLKEHILFKREIPDRPLYWHFPIYLEAYNPAFNENHDSLFRTRPGSVIRFGKWKLHHYFEDDAIELYNLETDPGEWIECSDSYPQKSDSLYQLLQHWREQTKAALPTER